MGVIKSPYDVEVPEQAPYEVTMTMRVPKPAIPQLNLGMRGHVFVCPERAKTVAIDWSRFPAA